MTDDEQSQRALRAVRTERRELPPSACPWCGHVMHGIGVPRGLPTPEAPAPGTVCVCLACATPLVFEAGWQRRCFSADEYLGLGRPERAELEALRRANRGTTYPGDGRFWPPGGDA